MYYNLLNLNILFINFTYIYFFFKILSKIIQVSSQNLQNFYLIMSKYVVLYTYRMINCVQSSMEVYFPTRAPLKPIMMCLLMYNQIGFLPYSCTAEVAHGAAHKKAWSLNLLHAFLFFINPATKNPIINQKFSIFTAIVFFQQTHKINYQSRYACTSYIRLRMISATIGS